GAATTGSRRAGWSRLAPGRGWSAASRSCCVVSGFSRGREAGRNRVKRTIAGSLVALLLAAACGGGPGGGPPAKLTDGKLVIAVINDQSGVYADLSGKNAVEAVNMAVEDFKAKYGENALGGKVEVLTADH